MKKYFLLILTLSLFQISNGQGFAIGLDKMNVFYLGVDNPITIAVENTSDKSLVIKTTNGKIIKEEGRYIFRGESVGTAEIAIYKKENNKLKKIGIENFRVKMMPAPIFKIGSGRKYVTKYEVMNQQFVRAEMEGFDYDVIHTVQSFDVCIIPWDTCKCIRLADTCKYGFKNYIGNKVSNELRDEFKKLKVNDVVVFKNIFAIGPEGTRELEPVMITIKKDESQ